MTNANGSTFNKCCDLPQLKNIVAKPSVHPIKHNTIVICTNQPYQTYYYCEFARDRLRLKSGNELNIFELNLITNQLKKIDINHQYDTCTSYDGTFIDTPNQSIHIFGNGKYCIFNFNSKTLKEMPIQSISDCGKGSATTYGPSPNHPEEIHILTKNMTHYQIHMHNNSVNKMIVWEFIEDGICGPNLLYSPYKEQLLSVGSVGSDKIWYCNIGQLTNTPRGNWRLSTLKLPRISILGEKMFDTILAFENIVFIIYGQPYSDVWCIDLLNNQLMKANYDIPNFSFGNIYIFKDDNDNDHIIDFEIGAHYIFDLLDLIPQQFVIAHQKYYQLLTFGYLIEQGKQIKTKLAD
eukprot:10718_1